MQQNCEGNMHQLPKWLELLKSNIEYQRNQLKWSQNELARRMGEKPPTLSDWLQGHVVPGIDKVAKMAEALGLEIGDLFTPFNEKKPKPQPLHSLKDCYEMIGKGCGLIDDNSHHWRAADPSMTDQKKKK